MTTFDSSMRRSLLVALALLALSGCDRDRDNDASRRDTTPPPADTVPPPAMPPPATSDTNINVEMNTSGSGDLTADDPHRTPGEVIDDSVITGKVKTAMLADDQVKGYQIDVDTHEGVVTLTGRVDTQTQLNRALDIATATSGVRSVNNQMTISSGG